MKSVYGIGGSLTDRELFFHLAAGLARRWQAAQVWQLDAADQAEDRMFEINHRLSVPEQEFEWSFVRSGGPGGQNVNKVASKAVLRWNVIATPSLPEDVKARLRSQQAGRITTQGILIINSQRYRDQERNREDCLEKLRGMALQAAAKSKKRRPTRPTRGSRERRLHTKKHRAAIKTGRRQGGMEG
jgi:ribosome-associated protein